MYKISKKTNYLKEGFAADKAFYEQDSHIHTGLETIDNNLSIRPSICLMGGLPSVGKTSLAVQFADNFSREGNPVLFFSLEQSEYDLTKKSLNRISAQYSCRKEDAIPFYMEMASNITTVTDNEISIDEIESVINDYMETIDKTPVIIIDYLQLIKADCNKAKNARDTATYISNQLARIAKTHKVFMLVLSALNRANYMAPIDFESFKESGSLEYDADILFGLQYQMINDDAFLKAPVEKKRIMIAEEKVKSIRQIEITCLKNRFGKIIPKCLLSYHCEEDLFVEEGDNDISNNTVVMF